MMYLIVGYSVVLVDEGFAADAVMLKGNFHEVDKLVRHSIVMCDDKSAVFVINCIVYG